MQEPWEKSPNESSVSFAGFRRDKSVVLSGVIAGLAAALATIPVHAGWGLLMGEGAFGFFREEAEVLFASNPAAVPLPAILSAIAIYLVAGVGVGVLFSLATDLLKTRNSILGLAAGFGVAIGALSVAFLTLTDPQFFVPDVEIFFSSVFFGLALVVQQPVMDLLSENTYAPINRDDPPSRLPVLDRA